MKQWKRLFFFLILNVLVSVCATLAVLFAWDQFRTPLPGGLIQPITINLARPAAPTPQPTSATTAETKTPDPALTPSYEIHPVQEGDTFESIAQTYGVSVEDLITANGYTRSQVLSPGELLRVPIRPVVIDNVIGAGDLESEHVIIMSNIDAELSLAGWQLEDNSGMVFTFPQVTLFVKERPLELYSKIGVNTSEKLYWGLQRPLWQSGMVVTLRDPRGAIQATYTIP